MLPDVYGAPAAVHLRDSPGSLVGDPRIGLGQRLADDAHARLPGDGILLDVRQLEAVLRPTDHGNPQGNGLQQARRKSLITILEEETFPLRFRCLWAVTSRIVRMPR